MHSLCSFTIDSFIDILYAPLSPFLCIAWMSHVRSLFCVRSFGRQPVGDVEKYTLAEGAPYINVHVNMAKLMKAIADDCVGTL